MAPLAIHAPPAVRIRNARLGSLTHAKGSGPTSPLKRASPLALSGTSGVSTSAEFPFSVPVVSQTRGPLTIVTPPRTPIAFPPAKTKPYTLKCNRPPTLYHYTLPTDLDH